MTHAALLDLARSTALAAGELARRRREEGVTVAASKSTVVDIVTEADREVERLVLETLAAARPDDGLLGEEGGVAESSSGLTWIVDPIDGTVNYLYGIPMYAVSIAVVEGDPDPQSWTALAGCVFNPASGDLFTASAGGGALLGDRSIRAAPVDDLAQALVGTGFGYEAAVRAEQGRVLAGMLPRVRDIRRLGAAALDLCFVADGRLDAFFESGLNPWDHAAGVLIAREAGATVRGLTGRAPDSDLVLAAAPGIAEELEGLLRAGSD
jgi:myo-inositol-1(or 4)-monophosphatase